MQLLTEPPTPPFQHGIGRVGVHELGRIAFRWSINRFGRLGELRQVEGVAVEHDDRGRTVLGLAPLQVAVLQHEEGALGLLGDHPALGHVDHVHLGIARVRHDDAEQHAARRAVADMEGEAAIGLGELAGPDDGSEQVRLDLRQQQPEMPDGGGGQPQRQSPDEDHDEDRQDEERSGDPRRRDARGRHDDQLGIAVELVEGLNHCDEQRDGRDEGEQYRDAEAGHHEEQGDGLAAVGHEVELPQDLRDPDDQGQDEQPGHEGEGGLPEYVAFEGSHSRLMLVQGPPTRACFSGQG